MLDTSLDHEHISTKNALTDKTLLAPAANESEFRLLPNVQVIKIGGQSLFDRGNTAVQPLVEEIVSSFKQHKLLLGTGAGKPARTLHSAGTGANIPNGTLHRLAASVADQNAKLLGQLLSEWDISVTSSLELSSLPEILESKNAAIVSGMPRYSFWMRSADKSYRTPGKNIGILDMLMAKWGISVVDNTNSSVVPMTMELANEVVFNETPPYKFWMHPANEGVIPPYRTDVGCFLMAEQFGCKSMIFVKDEDGLYTADPKISIDAKFIPEITVAEMKAMGLQDSILEFPVIDLLQTSQHIREVQIINGLTPGNLTRALTGEHVGTVIRA